MNARQKAKKLKKELKRLQDILDPKIPQIISGNLSKIETIKVVRILDGRIPVPEEILKSDIGAEFGRCLMENDLVNWQIDADNNYANMRKAVAWIKVVREINK
jgi:hypothetical protein